MSQPEPHAELLVTVQEGQFWLGKAVTWGQAESPDVQREACHYMGRLKAFLQLLLSHISSMSSTTESMQKLPFLGQFLGRLCWNPYITAHAECRGLLFQNLWRLYSETPNTALEKKANLWIRNLLCQLATEDDDEPTGMFVKHMGIPPREYQLKVLRKMVALQLEVIETSCSSLGSPDKRCSCDSVVAASVACIPLVTCPEAAPLIGALLRRPVTCSREVLSQDFLDVVSSAYSGGSLSLEEQAVVSLWCHNLPSLEGAVLTLLESALTDRMSTPHSVEQQLTQSLLPKACAQHCHVFLVVSDIFRSTLMQVEVNQSLLSLLHSFTCCFLRQLEALQPQNCLSFKAYFPNTPHSLLAPLIALPSQTPQEAWRHHLNWLSGFLQKLTEEEEDEEEGCSSRGQCTIFEAWFLLVQCAHWVEVAVQLLVTSGPEDSDQLLWLLTFYHHPTNRGHHRTQQLEVAKEAWNHLRCLFVVTAPLLPADRLQSLVELLLACPQRPFPAQLLALSLLVNFAIFSQTPLGDASNIVRMVAVQCGLRDEIMHVVSSVELRLNRGCSSSSHHNTVKPRITALQDTLQHTQLELS